MAEGSVAVRGDPRDRCGTFADRIPFQPDSGLWGICEEASARNRRGAARVTIRLETLGRLAIHRDSVEQTRLRNQQIPCALLLYLAIEGRTSRDDLMGLLWPRRGLEGAGHALSQTLYRLRRELVEDCVESEGGELRATSRITVDVRDFESAGDGGEWDRALDLYTGPFLGGVYLVDSNPFESWVDRVRSRLETSYALTNRRVIEDRLGRDDVEGALDVARRWVSFDPLEEQAQQTLIELLASAGHRLKALRQFEKYERLLSEELEVEPLRETQALIERVRAGEFDRLGIEPAEEPAEFSATGEVAVAPSTRSGRRPVGPWAVGVAAGLAILALMAVWLLPEGEVPPADTGGLRVAVLPFLPTAPDSALAQLGRDLVVTLSTNLDGLGNIRAIDPSAILANARGATQTEEEARELAEMLGATRFVHGRLIRTGERIRLDFGIFRTSGSSAVRRASSEGRFEDLMAMTDSTTWAIVRQLWREGDPPTPSLAAVTTRSVPALEAFLEGEHAIVEGRWMPAVHAYRRAVEIDSTFWLAYWRHATASRFIGAPVDSSEVEAYRRHRFDLPERERMLIELELAASLTERLALGRRIVERYPDYWPGWLEAGDDVIHLGPFLGYELVDAKPFFERALTLNMMLIPAWQHLIHFHMQDYDSAAVAAVIDTLHHWDAWEALEEGYGFNQLVAITVLDQLKRTGRMDPALRDPFLETMATIADLYGAENALGHLLRHDLPAPQIDVIRRLRNRAIGVDLVRESYRTEALAWVARGAWDSALVAADQFARRAAVADAPVFAYRVAVIGAWLGAVDPEAARGRRAPPPGVVRSPDPTAEAELLWLDGLLATAEQDEAGLRRAIEGLEASTTESADELVRSLRAFDHRLRGDTRRAAQELTALEWERAERLLRYNGEHPLLTAVNRLAAARWLRAIGGVVEAERLLRYVEALNDERTQFYTSNAAMASLVLAERGGIAMEAGETTKALRHFRAFLDRYDRPVQAHQPLVDAARAAVERLVERAP